MSLEDDGIQISWDEIKAASGRMDVDGRKREKQAERRIINRGRGCNVTAHAAANEPEGLFLPGAPVAQQVNPLMRIIDTLVIE